jgi:Subtilisin-like serine proteases
VPRRRGQILDAYALYWGYQCPRSYCRPLRLTVPDAAPAHRMPAGLLALLVTLVVVVVPAVPVWADSIRDREWHLGFLRVAEAHRHSRGAGVVVAVIDSGVDATHPDLAGSVLPGMDVQPGESNDGRIDIDGHGTGMAGLIAGHGHGTGNADGVLGIASQARILPVRDGYHQGPYMADAIAWATAHSAKVISISQGGTSGGLLQQQAIDDALAHDIVVVAAAGNIPGTSVEYPAAYPGVVAVSGVDQHGDHAEVSATGPQLVLSAPAVNVMSIGLGHGYGFGNGTSAATAIVAGAAALVRAKYPNLSATEVVHRLTATAVDKGQPGRDPVYGYGIVNLIGALTADVPPLQTTPSTATKETATATATTPTARAVLSPWLIIGTGLGLMVLAVGGLIVAVRRRGR